MPEKIVECFSDQYADAGKCLKEVNIEELIKLNEVDLQIVDMLSNDSRLPFRKIAEEIGVSIDTIARRYERLKKQLH